MLLSLLFQNPLVFIVLAVCLVFSLSFHEFAHAFIANKLGDPTAKNFGRLTLNPLAHLDPFGTLTLLLAGVGWGKPVPFNPSYLKNPQRDGALIAFAGPGSNFLMALLAAGLFHLVGFIGLPAFINAFLHTILYIFISLNLSLGFFNLLPFNPLDGFKVVLGFLPSNLAIQWIQTQNWGIYILLLLLITQQVSAILDPLLNFSFKLLGIN